jgi:hypothetical protein
MTTVGNKQIRQLVVDFGAVLATQAANDDFCPIAGALNPRPRPTPYDAKFTLATGAGDNFRTPKKKHCLWGFERAENLLQ